MKSRNYFILPIVAAGAVSLTSCGKKDVPAEAKIAEEVAAVVEKIAENVVEPAASVDELAAKAGFAKYMAKETTAMWTMYDGAGLAKKLRSSKLGAYFESVAKEQGVSLDEMLADEDFQKFADVAGEEMFFALGEGGAEEMGHLMAFSKKSNFYQFEALVKMFASELSGDTGMSSQKAEEYIINLAKDSQMQDAAEAVNMPPVFVGFKVTDAAKRKEFVEQLQGFAQMALDEQSEGEEFLELAEKDGFKGFRAVGEKIVKLAESDAAELAEVKSTLGEETAQRYLDALAKKNFVTLAGEYQDYVVIFAGASVDQLSFAATPQDSVLAHKAMDFARSYSSKDLVSLLYMNEAYVKLSVQSQAPFKYMVKGIQAGLASVESFGDTRILDALLTDLVKHEDAFFAPQVAGRAGMVTYLEEGIKLDSFYAGNAPAYDLKSKRQLSGVSQMDDVLFSANWMTNPAQTELGLAYIDAVGATVYQTAKQISGLDLGESSDFDQFKLGFGMADGMFKKDLLDIWGALRTDLAQGLGSESAVVIDTKGELPTVPMIPEGFVSDGKLPRYSYVSTVTDRSKISASWDTLNATATSALKRISQMTGAEIPMQRPFKSVSDGLTSWTFQIPFTHQNCTPNVSVSDDLFIVGSSPDFAAEIAAVYEEGATGAPMSEMSLNFDVLRDLGANWLAVVDQHGAGLMGEAEREQFEQVKPMLEAVLEASEDLDSFSVKTFESGGELRSKMHFKTR